MKLISLTRNKKAIIDFDDYNKVAMFNWYCLKNGYAARSEGGRKSKKMIYMHRFITNAPIGKDVDHINGNKLDNRKINLRICSHHQNTMRRSKNKGSTTSTYRGVYFDKARNKWVARIKHNYKDIFIGRFDSEIDAAKTYIEKSKKLRGMYAD